MSILHQLENAGLTALNLRKINENFEKLGEEAPSGIFDLNQLQDAFTVTEKQEMAQWSFSSGVMGSRQYTANDSFDPAKRTFDAPYAALNIHNHPNYRGQMGMAEVAVMINGTYYRSRHNDYRARSNQLSVGALRPYMYTNTVESHNHGFRFPLTEENTLDLMSGKLDSLVIRTGLYNEAHNHYHEWSISWNGTSLVSVPVADSTGHSHTLTLGTMSDNENSYPTGYLFAPKMYLNPDPDLPDSGVNQVTGECTLGSNQYTVLKNVWALAPANIAMDLAYIEFWFELVDPAGGVPDAGDSFRHAELAADLTAAYRRSTSLTASGHKNRLENISVGPAQIVNVTDDGTPIYANPVFRIVCKRVGNMGGVGVVQPAPTVTVQVASGHGHVLAPLTVTEMGDLKNGDPVVKATLGGSHIHSYTITFNSGTKTYTAVQIAGDSHDHGLTFADKFSGNLPYNKAKAAAGTIDSGNVFTLIRDLQSLSRTGGPDGLINNRRARFHVKDLDRICEMCPGIDGEGAFIEESHLNPDNGQLDVLADPDDINQPLNAAYYNREYLFSTDASGRNTAHRGFNDSNLHVARTNNPKIVNGYTYMLPLELLARSPVEEWFPFNFTQVARNVLEAEETAGNDGSTFAKALSGVNYNHFHFQTPYQMYSDTAPDPADPADTTNSAWVTTTEGNVVQCWASGMSCFTHDGVNRLRFPCYPLAQQFSYESSQFEVFKGVLKPLLEGLRAGTVTVDDIDDAF